VSEEKVGQDPEPATATVGTSQPERQQADVLQDTTVKVSGKDGVSRRDFPEINMADASAICYVTTSCSSSSSSCSSASASPPSRTCWPRRWSPEACTSSTKCWRSWDARWCSSL
jgi:hypothetical protein